jgi:hypothetical protein
VSELHVLELNGPWLFVLLGITEWFSAIDIKLSVHIIGVWNVHHFDLWKVVKDKIVEERVESIVTDEVHSQTKGVNFAIWVGKNAIFDSFKTLVSDSVVAKINELDGAVLLEKHSNGSCSIYIKSVLEQVDTLQLGVWMQRLCDLLDSINLQPILTQIQEFKRSVLFESLGKQLGSFQFDFVVR